MGSGGLVPASSAAACRSPSGRSVRFRSGTPPLDRAGRARVDRRVTERDAAAPLRVDPADLLTFRTHREGAARRQDFRIRWYGAAHGVVANPALEVKSKNGRLGTKSTSALEPFEYGPDLLRAPLPTLCRQALPADDRLGAALRMRRRSRARRPVELRGIRRDGARAEGRGRRRRRREPDRRATSIPPRQVLEVPARSLAFVRAGARRANGQVRFSA